MIMLNSTRRKMLAAVASTPSPLPRPGLALADMRNETASSPANANGADPCVIEGSGQFSMAMHVYTAMNDDAPAREPESAIPTQSCPE